MNKQIESIMLYHLEACIETFRWNAGSDSYDGLSVRFVKESLVTGYASTIQDVKKIIEKTTSRKTKKIAQEFAAKLQSRIDAAAALQ